MQKIYHLSTCDTCRTIITSIDTKDFEMINLREQMISKKDLEILYKNIGSYEALFNKRAQKLKLMTDEEKPKNEEDYKKLILSDYTFIKRPIVMYKRSYFVGNSSEVVTKLQKALPKNQ